jgi:hypothetical protein
MRTTTRLLAVLGALALAAPLGTSTVSAQPTDNQAKAEKAYTEADALFQVRKYDEAAKKFTEAYEAWPDTEFLYNIAQSYRLAGNCTEALYFYNRFKKLKKRDDGKELSESDPKRSEKIERFIVELEACVKQQTAAKDQQPDDISRPDGTKDPTKTGGDTTKAQPDKVATPGGEEEEEEEEEEEDVSGETTVGAKMLSARGGFGLAMVDTGDLDVPIQPAINIGAGYPIAAGPVLLDVGGLFTYTPLPYQTAMGTSETSTLVGLLVNAGATYPINDKIGARGEVGLGVLSWGGLSGGNPFTEMGATTDGALGMFSFRVGVSAEYAFTPNVVATVTPLSYSYAPAADGLAMTAVTNLSFLLGVGYRM